MSILRNQCLFRATLSPCGEIKNQIIKSLKAIEEIPADVKRKVL